MVQRSVQSAFLLVDPPGAEAKRVFTSVFAAAMPFSGLLALRWEQRGSS